MRGQRTTFQPADPSNLARRAARRRKPLSVVAVSCCLRVVRVVLCLAPPHKILKGRWPARRFTDINGLAIGTDPHALGLRRRATVARRGTRPGTAADWSACGGFSGNL